MLMLVPNASWSVFPDPGCQCRIVTVGLSLLPVSVTPLRRIVGIGVGFSPRKMASRRLGVMSRHARIGSLLRRVQLGYRGSFSHIISLGFNSNLYTQRCIQADRGNKTRPRMGRLGTSECGRWYKTLPLHPSALAHHNVDR